MLEAHNKTVQVLGIDTGGTITDTFFVNSSGEFVVDIAQSKPKDESKDPLKQIMQSYFPMQEEKADRIYGALRANMFRQTQPCWLEWQKLFLSITPFPEISAARAMPVPNPEIQNCLALQGVRRKGDLR